MWMTASKSQFNFRCSHFQRQTAMESTHVTGSWVPYHKHFVIRSPRTNDSTRPPAVADHRKKKAVPWLYNVAQVVNGMVYSVVANRRQPNLYVVVVVVVVVVAVVVSHI